MTVEEIERILQTVAENLAKLTGHAAQTDERLAQVATWQSRHSADIAEIDAGIAMLLQSQNRYDEQLSAIREIMHDLADKHLKNEERFAELAEARRVNEMRLDKMEASYELLEQFVRDFREETHARLQETDNHFVETDKRRADLAVAQAKPDEQIKGLAMAQARTDEQIRSLLDRNGSATTPKAKAKRVKRAKKTAKKGSAK